jgi:hypothetical protein
LCYNTEHEFDPSFDPGLDCEFIRFCDFSEDGSCSG